MKPSKQIVKTVPRIGADWPILAGPISGEQGANSVESLVQFMIAEAVAEAKGEAGTTRALLTLGTAVKYLEFHELAAAERKFALADDILRAAPQTDPRWEGIALAVRAHRADLLATLRRHDEADTLCSEADRFPLANSHHGPVQQANRKAQLALAALEKGQLDRALDLFPPCIDEFRRLVGERPSDEAAGPRQRPDCVIHQAAEVVIDHDFSVARFVGVSRKLLDDLAVLFHRRFDPTTIDGSPGQRLGID
jgi:hypothetical protein